MPRLSLVYPSMGRRPGGGFVRSWEWEPLAIGLLAALTPPEWDIRFFDDRVEAVDFEAPTDLAALSVETYSARRAYEIAAEFRRRGVPVVMGGFHATACPDEVLEHADAVCVGEAEGVWARILEDARGRRLSGRYEGPRLSSLGGVRIDRSLFQGKGYIPVALVEAGRGCSRRCEFCSISAFYQASYRSRPPDEVAAEAKATGARHLFLVDDNLTGNTAAARKLFAALKPLRIRWISQTGLHGLEDSAFVHEMAESGCMGVLVGFESLQPENLAAMRKPGNRVEQYALALENLRKAGIFVYGTFLFGYPHDTRRSFERSVRFAIREKMFMAAFNHLVPFPGTPLYAELENAGRLRYPKWWLSEEFRFGQVPHDPVGLSAEELERLCVQARRDFYGIGSVLRRAMEFRCNCASPRNAFHYFTINRLMRREVDQKRDIPLGFAAHTAVGEGGHA